MIGQLVPLLVPMHGIGGRGDLPVPLWLAVYSAAAAVAVSFFALAAFWSRPRFEPSPRRGERGSGGLPLARQVVDSRVTRWLLKATGLLALAALLSTAWLGSSSTASNPAPTWLYVWMWVGIIPLSLLLGPVWRLANPLRTLASLVRFKPRPLPDAVGVWPAVAGLAVFVWLELAYPGSSEPVTVAGFVTAYTIVNVALGIWFGPRWFSSGDSFEVYAELLARLSPWGRTASRQLVLRNPLAGLASTPRRPGLVGLLAVLLGSTAFDGISRWSFWSTATGDLGRGQHLAVYTAGLAASIALVGLVFVLAARSSGSARVRPGAADDGLPAAFAHSLVPIVIGYAVAHYFSFALFQGQAGVLLSSDPFGRGWDLLGLDGVRIDYAVVGTSLIAAVQIGAIVLGHVLGVVSAHDRATALFRRRQLRRAQYPLLAAMVAFTAGGIALVAGS